MPKLFWQNRIKRMKNSVQKILYYNGHQLEKSTDKHSHLIKVVTPICNCEHLTMDLATLSF